MKLNLLVGALAAALALAVGQPSSVLSYSEMLCDCDDCCVVNAIDLTKGQMISLNSEEAGLSAQVWPVDNESYKWMFAWPVVERLTHFDLFAVTSAESVDCGRSFAYVNNKEQTMTPKSVPMQQQGPKHCRVDWDGDQIAADFYIYTDMGRDIVTIFDIQRPLFRVDDFTALKASDSEDGPDAASSILLSFGYYDRRDKDVCAAPDTVWLQIGDCASFEVSVSAEDYNFNYKTALVLAEVASCATSTRQLLGEVEYTVDVALDTSLTEIPAGCDPTKALIDPNTTRFFVTTATDVSGTVSLGEISNVATIISSHGVLAPCDNRIEPQAIMFFELTHQVTDKDLEALTTERFIYTEDATFEIVGEADCKKQAKTYTCVARYESQSCMVMSNVEGDQPGSLSCTFDNLGEIRTTVEYSRTGGILVPAYRFVDTLPQVEYMSPDCATPASAITLNAEFPVTVTAKAMGGMSERINVEMRYSDPSQDKADVETTFFIHTVTVTANGITRVFNDDVKVALMAADQSPYAQDAHFCRCPAASPGSCSPFYDKHSNAFTQSAAAASLFSVPSKGFFECQDNFERNVDRFTFTPTKWDAFVDLITLPSVDMSITVFATLSTCLTPQERRLRMLGYRSLQGESDGETKLVNSSATLTIVNYFVQDSLQGDGAHLPVGLIIAVSLGVVLVLVLFIARRRLKRDGAKNAELDEDSGMTWQPKPPVLANQSATSLVQA